MSPVTLVRPAKAVGRNEMPFGRDTRVVPSNSVLDRGSLSKDVHYKLECLRQRNISQIISRAGQRRQLLYSLGIIVLQYGAQIHSLRRTQYFLTLLLRPKLRPRLDSPNYAKSSERFAVEKKEENVNNITE